MLFRILLGIAFILSTALCHAQKRYKFDYLIETEVTFFQEDSVKKRILYLTNSKDNSYFAELTTKDSLNYSMRFLHQDKLQAIVTVGIIELLQAEYINLSCYDTYKYSNKFKYKTKEYDFFLLKDTIINENEYAVYEYKNILSYKKRKRRGAGKNLFIIDKTTAFHLPILTHPTAYEDWKLHRNIPNGLFVEKKFITVEEEEYTSEKLISYTRIDKKIVIPKECDYSQ